MKNSILLSLLICFCSVAFANNMLVQNVTTIGNNAGAQTIQVQFDISWDNSWRDAINWDAAWIFMKFKDANGLWQHCKLNQTGFANGTGTGNTVQVTSDKVGSWLYRSAQGAGTFNTTGIQLQWNYGLSGLTDVTGLEVRVFAVEMVYVPEGEFNCAGKRTVRGSYRYTINGGSSSQQGEFYAPGDNFPVINNRLSPTLTYNDGTASTMRIKGDAGIDADNNGTVDNTTYPTGYRAFYCYKYELTEQQYADFFNTLTASQIATLGLAGVGITLSNGQYFSSTPNLACGNSSPARFLAYADWSGVRPMTILEINKASYGPLMPVTYFNTNVYIYPAWGGSSPQNNITDTPVNAGYLASSNSTRVSSGASYYGILELTGSSREPVVKLNYLQFSSQNGNGQLLSTGNYDVLSWVNSGMIIYYDMMLGLSNVWSNSSLGFRYVRSAE
jgi:hypothetical protein